MMSAHERIAAKALAADLRRKASGYQKELFVLLASEIDTALMKAEVSGRRASVDHVLKTARREFGKRQ